MGGGVVGKVVVGEEEGGELWVVGWNTEWRKPL